MTKLTPTERAKFFQIVLSDMDAIQSAIAEQLQKIWDETREEVLREKGHYKLMERKDNLNRQIERLREEIHKIERELNADSLTVQQIVELGGKPNNYGHYEGAKFYGIPVKNQIDYEIVQRIKANIDMKAPAKFIHDLGRSVVREITMAGTFEDAQKVYGRFYAMDFRKYGVDIPPRLSEVKRQNPLLTHTNTAVQIEDKRSKQRRSSV